ncbi:hypothetical protein B0H11DRAFT_1915012 [Mycena galericulata]|nr:hypothetical protein B0H11DRAFT_1915012 [Mycena galericulata]
MYTPYIGKPLPQISPRIQWPPFSERPLPQISPRSDFEDLQLVVRRRHEATELFQRRLSHDSGLLRVSETHAANQDHWPPRPEAAAKTWPNHPQDSAPVPDDSGSFCGVGAAGRRTENGGIFDYHALHCIPIARAIGGQWVSPNPDGDSDVHQIPSLTLTQIEAAPSPTESFRDLASYNASPVLEGIGHGEIRATLDGTIPINDKYKTPPGQPGRPNSGGFNLKRKLLQDCEWTREAYNTIQADVHSLAKANLDTSQSYQHQNNEKLRKLCKEIAEKHDLRRYEDFWPIRAMLKLYLKTSSETHRRAHKCQTLMLKDAEPPEIIDVDAQLNCPSRDSVAPVSIDVDALSIGPGSTWAWPISIDTIKPKPRFKRHKSIRSSVASKTIVVQPVHERLQGISSLPYELIETVFRFTIETDDDLAEDIPCITETISHLHLVCKSWRAIARKTHALRAFISIAFPGSGRHPGSIDSVYALEEQIKAAGQHGLRVVFRFPDQGGEKYSDTAVAMAKLTMTHIQRCVSLDIDGHSPCVACTLCGDNGVFVLGSRLRVCRIRCSCPRCCWNSSTFFLDIRHATSLACLDTNLSILQASLQSPGNLSLSCSLTHIYLQEQDRSTTLLLLQHHAASVTHFQWSGHFLSRRGTGTNTALCLPITLPALSNLTFQNITSPPTFRTPVIENLVLQGPYPPFRSLIALCHGAPLRLFDCAQANVTTRDLIQLLSESPHLEILKISTGKDVQGRQDFYRALLQHLGSNYFWKETQPFHKLVVSDPIPVREEVEYDHLQDIAHLRDPLTTVFHSKGFLLGLQRYGEHFVDWTQIFDIIRANQLENHVMWTRTWTHPQGRPSDTDLVLVLNNQAVLERCLRHGLSIDGVKFNAVYSFRRPRHRD